METERELLPENERDKKKEDTLHVDINPEEASPVVFEPTGKSPTPVSPEHSEKIAQKHAI